MMMHHHHRWLLALDRFFDLAIKNKMLQSSFPRTWFWQDQAMRPCPNSVPLSDRGFRYGQHLFETLAVRDGHIFFFEEHWERLLRAAMRHHFPIDTSWKKGALDFLEKISLEDGIIRIFLTAGEGSPASPIVAPQLFLFWEKSNFPSLQKRQEGIKVVSLDQPIGTTSWGEKTGNYWEHLNALEAAHQAGAEEGLIFDQEGFLISASMANVILWLEGEIIVTPPRSRGARDGVILDQMRQHLPMLIESDFRRDDLKKVTAMALTNSRLGVMPVASLDGVQLTIRLSIKK